MTKLFLRNSTTSGITGTGDGILYDLSTTAGSSADTATTNTTASGTEIQLTKTAGGSTIAWISGRVPSGGFTLTTTDISLWQQESNSAANIGGRYRIFKRAANGTITELGGGPFDDGVEMNTANREDTWVGNNTDTAFAEDDRILIRLYLTNIGTMGNARTGTLTFNAADAATGDSFFNINETVNFKPNDISLTTVAASVAVGTPVVNVSKALSGNGATAAAGTVSPGITSPPAFPTTSILDDFNRVNEGPPPSANWGGSWESGSVGMVVASNACTNSSNTNGTSYWSASLGPDVEAFVTLTGVGNYEGVAARLQGTLGSSPNGYYVQAESTNVVLIFRIDGGSFVQLGSSISQTVANGDSLGISVIGSTITAYYKVGAGAWTSLGTRTDSTYSAAGKIGVRSSGTSVIFDDFGGGAVSTTADVTVALSGVSASLSAGSLTSSRTSPLTGPSASASTGSLLSSFTFSLTGNAAAFAINLLLPSSSLAVSGLSSTASTGALTTSRSVSFSGNETASAVGTLTPVIGVTVALSGAESTSSTGAFGITKSGSVQVSGVQAVTGLGTVGLSNSLSISGAQSSSAVNTFGLSKSGQLALTSISLSLAIQSLTPNLSNAVSSVTSTQSIGTLPVARSVNLSGISLTVDTGSVGASSPGEAALSGVSTTPSVGTLGFTKSGQIAITGVESTTASGDVGFSESGQVEASGNQAAGQAGDVLSNRTVALTGSEATGIAGSIGPLTSTAISSNVATGEFGTVIPDTNLSITTTLATGEAGQISFVSNTILVDLSGVFAIVTAGSMLPYDANPSYTAVLTVISKPSAVLTVEQHTANITVVSKPSAVLGLI